MSVTKSAQQASILLVAAFAWCGLLVLGATTVPVYGSSVESSAGKSASWSSTLVQVDGRWILTPLIAAAGIVMLVGLLMAIRRAQGGRWTEVIAWGLTLSLAVVCLAAALTIGLLALPVVGLLSATIYLTPDAAGGQPFLTLRSVRHT